jgi:hypothetical protein
MQQLLSIHHIPWIYYCLFPVSVTKNGLKGQFTSTEEVSKNGFQECFQKLYERWKKSVTAQENYFEGNVV